MTLDQTNSTIESGTPVSITIQSICHKESEHFFSGYDYTCGMNPSAHNYSRDEDAQPSVPDTIGITDSCKTLSYSLVDATQQGEVQRWITPEIHQISRGIYEGRCTTLSMDEMHVVHEHQNQSVHKTGVTPKNICTVSMAFSTDPALRFSQFDNSLDSWLFLLPEEQAFDIKLPGNTETLYVCLEQDKLMADARILDERYWEKAPEDLQVFNTPLRDTFADRLMWLLRHFGTVEMPSVQTMITDTILLAMNNANGIITSEQPEYRVRLRAHQLVKDARAFIDDRLRLGHSPSVVDVCAHTGVSERTLQYAFQRELQLSPLAYMRIVRLNRARAQLLAAAPSETTVTDIATAWGFFHLGKFSQDYRRMFGERPSETLASFRR